MAEKKPNFLILWGDDIGWWNISYNSRGQMGYRTPNIDRIANEGVAFTDYYGQQSCTAGRAAFITGQKPIRTGLTKVGMPGAEIGLRRKTRPSRNCLNRWVTQPVSSARTIWATRTSSCRPCTGSTSSSAISIISTPKRSRKTWTIPRTRSSRSDSAPGACCILADGKGGQKIEDTGPLTKKRMETIDDEVTDHALRFIDKSHKEGQAVLSLV